MPASTPFLGLVVAALLLTVAAADFCATNGAFTAAAAGCKGDCGPSCKNGKCNAEGMCICNPGYAGLDCKECAHGYTKESSACVRGCPAWCPTGKCGADGSCACSPGWTGPTCDRCAVNYYGPSCTFCTFNGTCSGNGYCNGTGICRCFDGFGNGTDGPCSALSGNSAAAAGAAGDCDDNSILIAVLLAILFTLIPVLLAFLLYRFWRNREVASGSVFNPAVMAKKGGKAKSSNWADFEQDVAGEDD
eukprot:NODE_913_length_1139_cov_458.057798_g631_i0.p1 GENE.NODE_913_length_1139_cov_458.057798_g631_i0~~NODE_913_length_1139_cov_458.057798_g631_i0.p1  ORF type:complete len:247 (+),score=92.00 NODE_913_length_1139_cov_458.057798_g631_i0:96-836(+)